MDQNPEQIEIPARRLARLCCYQELDMEVSVETVETVLAIIRIYEDENWPRFVEEAERILRR